MVPGMLEHHPDRALANLVDNAVRHASSGVELSACAEGPKVVLSVDDDGTYRVTLGSQDFFWLRVRSAPDALGVQPPTQSMPIITSLG